MGIKIISEISIFVVLPVEKHLVKNIFLQILLLLYLLFRTITLSVEAWERHAAKDSNTYDLMYGKDSKEKSVKQPTFNLNTLSSL